jgi:hypothetical protein
MMRNYRFSIGQLMVVLVIFGVGIAALLNASPFWIIVCSTISTALFLGSVLGVICRKEGARAFCAGFLIFGMYYTLLANPNVFRTNGLINPHQHAQEILAWLDLSRKNVPKTVGATVEVAVGGGYQPAVVTKMLRENLFQVVVEPGKTMNVEITMIRGNNRYFYNEVGDIEAQVMFSFLGAVLARVLRATQRESPR